MDRLKRSRTVSLMMPGGSRCSVEELTDFRFRVFSASPIVSMVSPRWAGGRGGAEEQRCSVGDDHLLGRSPQECQRAASMFRGSVLHVS